MMKPRLFPLRFLLAFTGCSGLPCGESRAAECGLDTWTVRTPLIVPWLRDAAFGAGRFVAVGDNGLMLTSTDGSNWLQQVHPSNIAFARVSFANGQFFATGRKFGAQLDAWEGLLWSSADGLNWVPRYSMTNTVVCGVAYDAGRLVAVAVNAPVSQATRALTSPDGIQWTSIDMPGSGWLYDIAAGNGRFVAVGVNRIMYSTDGSTWLASVLPGVVGLQAVDFLDGQFIAVGLNGQVLTSPTGELWTPRASGVTNFLAAVAGGNGTVAVAGNDGAILTSTDGVNWTLRPNLGPHLRGLAFGVDGFVAVGRYGTVVRSGPVSPCSGSRLEIVPVMPPVLQIYGTVGASYRIEYVDDLRPDNEWQFLQQLPALPASPYTIYDPKISPTGQRFYRAVRLP